MIRRCGSGSRRRNMECIVSRVRRPCRRARSAVQAATCRKHGNRSATRSIRCRSRHARSVRRRTTCRNGCPLHPFSAVCRREHDAPDVQSSGQRARDVAWPDDVGWGQFFGGLAGRFGQSVVQVHGFPRTARGETEGLNSKRRRANLSRHRRHRARSMPSYARRSRITCRCRPMPRLCRASRAARGFS